MEDDCGDNLGVKLQKILHENELEKSLTDERIRAEEYKTSLESLKIDYVRLQQEYAGIMAEMTNVYDEIKLVRERDRSLLEEAKKDIISKLAEIERLKSQSVDSPQVRAAQMHLKEEVEESFKKLMQKQEAENDSLKREYNKLAVENAFLKSKFENDRRRYEEGMDDLKVRHERSVEMVRRERGVQEVEERADSLSDLRRMKQLQKQNFELLERNKLLMVQSKKAEGYKCHMTSRVNETEKQLWREEREELRRELREAMEEREEAVLKALSTGKHLSQEASKQAADVQRLKREVADVKVEAMRKMTVVEKEKQKWKGLFEDARVEVEILRTGMGKMEERLVEREKQMLAEMEEGKKQTALMKSEDDLRTCKEAAELEVSSLRSRVSGHEALMEELEREKKEGMMLKEQLARLQTQVSLVMETKNALSASRDKIEALEDELERNRTMVGRVRSQVEEEWRDRLVEEGALRNTLQAKLHELQGQLTNANKKIVTNLHAYKQKSGQLKTLLMRHKQKLNSLTAKLHAAEVNMGNQEDADVLRRRLKELEQRCEDFGVLLLQPQVRQETIAGMSFAGMEQQQYLPFSADPSMDWLQVKRKIESIGLSQRNQLQELKLKVPTSE